MISLKIAALLYCKRIYNIDSHHTVGLAGKWQQIRKPSGSSMKTTKTNANPQKVLP